MWGNGVLLPDNGEPAAASGTAASGAEFRVGAAGGARPGAELRGARDDIEHGGEEHLQLSSLARHYEQSTSNFKAGTCDTLAARQRTLSQLQLSQNLTPPPLPDGSRELGLRPSSAATSVTSDLPSLGRTAHRAERRRRLSTTGKKSTPRGVQWLAPLAALLLLRAVVTGKQQARLGWLHPAAVLAALLQLPAVAASQDTTSAPTESLHDDALSTQPPSVLLILAVLLPLYYAYSAYVGRAYPPRMHVLWDGLRGKFLLDEYGPVECLRQAQRKHGEIFRICLPGQSCTFLIGKEACQHWFKQPNVSHPLHRSATA